MTDKRVDSKNHFAFNKIVLLYISISFFIAGVSSQPYEIDARIPAAKFYGDHLKLGGTSSNGDVISVNNYYISYNDIPFIPITGEFHFSRYSNLYWDESIKKMKAGGINVIATYVFWNIHEELEGKFDWKGDKDIRRFIELCKRNDMKVIVRVGPFCHGEIRSGGLPDWLLGRPLIVRSNDPKYLYYVERLYNEIGNQLKGLYFKNDGPVIGIQIENEYQHSAAPWGLTYPGQPHDFTAAERDLRLTQQGVGISNADNPYANLGNDHMKLLKTLAIKAGMDVPLYTATGWGNAAIIPNESIPVTAAYAYPFWTENRDLSPFFLYKEMHKFPDYAPVRYKPEDYPAFPAELGSGIMSVYSRRPIAVHKSFDAMINRCLGSGANGIGYYMYHGGSTPRGKNNYFSDEAYGLPKISYDFQAPIGEFGQVREGFHRLKLLHFFVKDFGDILAPMQTVLPLNASSIKPENLSDLRYAARVKGNSGFLFFNNFQDDTLSPDKKNIKVMVRTNGGDITIPETTGFTLKSEENVIFPFNFNLSGANLIYATAQLLVKNDDKENPYYVFFTPPGIKAEFSISKQGVIARSGFNSQVENNKNSWLVKCKEDTVCEFTIRLKDKKITVLILPKVLALKSYVTNINTKKYLLISDAIVLKDSSSSFTLLNTGSNSFSVSVYPRLNSVPKISNGTISKVVDSNPYSTFILSLPEEKLTIKTNLIGEKKLVVELPKASKSLNDIYLQVNYTGDTGMAFLDGELVADEFYKGIPWQIGLRRFLNDSIGKEMVLYFRPMYKNASYLLDLAPYPQSIPDFGNKQTYLKIGKVELIPEYKSIIKF